MDKYVTQIMMECVSNNMVFILLLLIIVQSVTVFSLLLWPLMNIERVDIFFSQFLQDINWMDWV